MQVEVPYVLQGVQFERKYALSFVGVLIQIILMVTILTVKFL